MTDAQRHSIKVPRLFKTASKIAQLVREEGGSLKELVYNGKHPNIKALYALVVQTLQHEKELNSIVENSKILEKEKGLDPWLARVLITELTWGKRRLSGESKPVKTVLSYQSSFNTGNEGSDDVGNQLEVGKVQLPRYVRVNTIYLTVKEVVDYFRNEGWLLGRQGDEVLFPSTDHFRVDSHIPDVLAFPPGTELYSHPLYRDRSILLQDKASCLAAHLLAPPNGSTVLDMCAAPGMKTTHLAARMNNKGTLYAVEKDPKRYKTLCSFVEEAGATCVKTILGDSVQLKAEEVPGVEYILVDPSCSGTGMVSRPKVGSSLDTGLRLRNLVGFQRRLLLHALTSFPNATRVVYSTCSLLPDENEGVVSWALNEVSDGPHQSGWHLTKDLLLGWTNRGCEETYPGIGKHCMYSHPETDLTNGFFLAMFERTAPMCSKGLARNQSTGLKGESVEVGKRKKEGEPVKGDKEDTSPPKIKKKKRKNKKGCEEGKGVEVSGRTGEKGNEGVTESGEEGGGGSDGCQSAFSKRTKEKSERNEEKNEEESARVVIFSAVAKKKNEVGEENGDEGKDGDDMGAVISDRIKKKKKKRKKLNEEEKDGQALITAGADDSKKRRGEGEGREEWMGEHDDVMAVRVKRKRGAARDARRGKLL